MYNCTLKQQLFVKQYLCNGMNGTDAAMVVYNVKNRSTAAVIASENLIKPKILNSIALLAPAGIIWEESVTAISRGLEATKGVNKLPDHRTQLKAASMAIKLLEDVHNSVV